MDGTELKQLLLYTMLRSPVYGGYSDMQQYCDSVAALMLLFVSFDEIFMYVADWSKWEQSPSGDDTPKGGWPRPPHSLPDPLPTSWMMSEKSGRGRQYQTRMMSLESGRKFGALRACDGAASTSGAAPAVPYDDTGGP